MRTHEEIPTRHGLLTPGLTAPDDPKLATQLAYSAPGMAHWGGTGPEGTTCRECKHWGRSARFKRFQGFLRRRECQAFIRLMRGEHGDGVDNAQPSCRHFEFRSKAPPVEAPLRKSRERKA